MSRYLGYRNTYENCYQSTFGLQAARIYSEKIYCKNGFQHHVHNDQSVNGYRCPEWDQHCKYFFKHGGEPKPTFPKKRS